MESLLNISVSCFANYNTPDNPRPVNLMLWLTSAKYADQVKQIRTIDDKAERDKIKGTLPAITPSGIFTYRAADKLVQHSGFIQFDIDFKDNQHISNYDDLKSQLCNINNVAYCGLSVSGRGYWGLIPIQHPDKHKSHFRALKNAFSKLGLTIDDKPSNVAALRGYSYDPDAYFNHDTEVFTLLDKPRPARKMKRTHYDNDSRSEVEALIEQIQANRIDITGGYDEWLKVGFALADEFGEAGRDYFHAVSQYHSDYNEREADRQYSHCLRGNGQGITISSFFFLAKQYGIVLYSGDYNHANKKDGRSTGKYEARQHEVKSKKRDYPASWDVPPPEPGSQEDIEAVRAVVNDAAPDELRELMNDDPMIQQIVETFDAEMVVN